MRVLRIVLVAVLAVLGPLAASGFWVDRALDDSTGFARQMTQAWRTDEALQEEFRANLLATMDDQLSGALESSGSGFLSGIAEDFATSAIEDQLPTPQFAAAWARWTFALHDDLALIARGGTPRVTAADGSLLTVDVSPLIEALIPGGLAGFALSFLGDDLNVQQFDAEYDIETSLSQLGMLWSLRWWAILAAAGSLAALTVAWRPPLRGVAVGLLAAAAGCLATGIWRSIAGTDPPIPEPTALGSAMSAALIGGWAGWMFGTAALLAVTSGALAVVDRRRFGAGGAAADSAAA